MTFSNTIGFDFSYYQAAIDFQKVEAYGAKFIILRCGYAVTKDLRFDEYMAQVDLPVSVYHYYDPILNPLEQAKKIIAILAPYKDRVRRVWLDFEFYWAGAYAAPEHWLNYRNAIERAGYQTGIYTRATWWNERVGSFAAEFAKRPVWVAQYNTALTLIPKGWTKAMLWQKGTPAIGPLVGTTSKEVDFDVWNDEFDFVAEWGTVSPLPADVVSTPYDGMTKVSGVRGVYPFHLFKLNTDLYRFELVVCNPTETISSVVKRTGALLGLPAGDYARFTNQIQDWTVSNGVERVKRDPLGGRPSLMILKDGSAVFDTKNAPNVQQAFTGVHTLIWNGEIAPALDDLTQAQNTEGHARFLFGLDAAGNVLLMASQGVFVNQGLTLKQAAQVLKDNGAVRGGDGGGGGDVACVFEGQSLIVPENIVAGANVERYLPAVFLVFRSASMANKTYKVVWGPGVNKRKGPSTSSDVTGVTLPFDSRVEVIQDNISDTTFPADPTKVWVQFADGSYGASLYGAGSVRMVDVTPVVVPPVSTLPDVPFTFEIGDDVKYIKQTFSGVLKAK